MFSKMTPKDFTNETTITASRSSGPGGQNVNKVNTKVEIRLNINDSNLLTSEEKNIILQKLANKINSVGELIVVSQSERTQLRNKVVAIKKLNELITNALKVEKKRIPTKKSKSKKEKRLKDKKITSNTKKLRKDPEL